MSIARWIVAKGAAEVPGFSSSPVVATYNVNPCLLRIFCTISRVSGIVAAMRTSISRSSPVLSNRLAPSTAPSDRDWETHYT